MTTSATAPSPAERQEDDGPYPAHWEADIVLADGATARIRPITPDDADMLVSFYARVSEES